MKIVKKKEFLEVKFKVRYLEYYYMRVKIENVPIAVEMETEIKLFILSNGYELTKERKKSWNKNEVKVPIIIWDKLIKLAAYSDNLKIKFF